MSSLVASAAYAWEFVGEHPEGWLVPLSLLAWAAMAPHMLADGVACHQVSFWADWQGWGLMVLAMMAPLTLSSLRWVGARSLPSRAVPSQLFALLGYLLPWALAGLAVAWLLAAPWTRSPWLPTGCFLLAGLWSLTPWSESLMESAHRTIPLAPTGLRADLDCLRAGLLQGAPCLARCGVLMLGCTLTGHGGVAMVGGAALAALERLSFQPRRWWVPAGCALIALWYAPLGS